MRVKPRRKPPAGACDCHAHVIGSTARHPLAEVRAYTPPDALLEDYEALLAALGFERAVIVQPSVYGYDNACTLEAVRALGPRGRAVVVVDPAASDAELAEMAAAGACGLRFNLVTPGGFGAAALEPMAARAAALGWHVQLYVDTAQLVELAPRIAALPCPVAIDHMGQPDLKAGTEQPGFRTLLELLVAGRVWVKLSGAYRIDPSVGHAAAAPFARALINAAPDRCVWGTDWPHTRCEIDPPDDGQLLNQLADWAPDEALWRAILVDNPAKLYGF